jgi:hypothetical protein
MWAFPPIQDATCLRKGQIILSGGVIKTLIDFVLIIIPIPLIMSLNLKKSRRISIFSLLSLGSFVTIAGGFRVHSIWQMYFKSDDRTWIGGSASFASALELDFGIVSFSHLVVLKLPIIVESVVTWDWLGGARILTDTFP